MIVAYVDRDYINPEPEVNTVGKSFELTAYGLLQTFTNKELDQFDSLKTRFRCLDDDEEVYYGGWLYNDNDCEIQLAVLAWAMADAGATIIEIKVDDEWKREIG